MFDPSAGVHECLFLPKLAEDKTCITDVKHSCDGSSLQYCDCVYINRTFPNATQTIDEINDHEMIVAAVSFGLAVLSLLLGVAYLACFVVWPQSLWHYPLSLAFWIYPCDLAVTIQFLVVGWKRLMYGAGDPNDPWLLTSDPACLCAMDPAHPGCACNHGVLSFMLQAGVVGSVCFFCALAHNFFRSVSDPFTRPRSRLAKYHLVVWPMALMFSWWYLPPSPPPAFDGSAMVGYGYRPQFMMCWAPDRRGPRFQLNNAQAFVTATVPIFVLWLTAPVLYLYARRLLRMGGSPTEAMLEPRRRQLQQTETLLRVFSIYWFLTGLAYLVGYAFEVYEGEGACDPYDATYDGKVAYDAIQPRLPRVAVVVRRRRVAPRARRVGQRARRLLGEPRAAARAVAHVGAAVAQEPAAGGTGPADDDAGGLRVSRRAT